MAIFGQRTAVYSPPPGLGRPDMRLQCPLSAVTFEQEGRYWAMRGTCLLGEIVVVTHDQGVPIEPQVILNGVHYGCTMFRIEVADDDQTEVEVELRPFVGGMYEAAVVAPRLPSGRGGGQPPTEER